MEGEKCPFEFNFDPATFKTGDVVSYRVPESFGEMPFVGTLLSVHDDYVHDRFEYSRDGDGWTRRRLQP